MDLLGDLLLLPITGPYRGLKALLGALRDEADAVRYDAARVRAELSELELRRDIGEISEEEYQEQEALLLERLNENLALEDERRRDEPPGTVEGEIVGDAVGPVLGEVLGVQAGDGGAGYVEYVDGDYAEEDEYDEGEGDYVDEDDRPEPDEGRRP